MDRATKKRLERAGWRTGSAADFLGMPPEEAAYVEMRLALSDALRARREDAGMSQETLATALGSSQSRVSKMEAGDPGISIDLMVRALLATGAERADIARAVEGATSGKAAPAG